MYRGIATHTVDAGPVPTHEIGIGSNWPAARAVQCVHDATLRDPTLRWIATLPAVLRPMATGQRFPRILNRICDLWPHCEYSRQHFQALLIDRRKDRKGFPPAVRAEIEALQHHYFEQFSGLPAIIWNAVPVNAPRIPQKVFPPHPHATEIELLPRYVSESNPASPAASATPATLRRRARVAAAIRALFT